MLTDPIKRKQIPKKLRFKILNRDSFTCKYCGRTANETELHIDHIIPVSLGGKTYPSNLVTACIDCNLGKSNHTFVVPHDILNPVEHFSSIIGDWVNDKNQLTLDSIEIENIIKENNLEMQKKRDEDFCSWLVNLDESDINYDVYLQDIEMDEFFSYLTDRDVDDIINNLQLENEDIKNELLDNEFNEWLVENDHTSISFELGDELFWAERENEDFKFLELIEDAGCAPNENNEFNLYLIAYRKYIEAKYSKNESNLSTDLHIKCMDMVDKLNDKHEKTEEAKARDILDSYKNKEMFDQDVKEYFIKYEEYINLRFKDKNYNESMRASNEMNEIMSKLEKKKLLKLKYRNNSQVYYIKEKAFKRTFYTKLKECIKSLCNYSFRKAVNEERGIKN